MGSLCSRAPRPAQRSPTWGWDAAYVPFKPVTFLLEPDF